MEVPNFHSIPEGRWRNYKRNAEWAMMVQWEKGGKYRLCRRAEGEGPRKEARQSGDGVKELGYDEGRYIRGADLTTIVRKGGFAVDQKRTLAAKVDCCL